MSNRRLAPSEADDFVVLCMFCQTTIKPSREVSPEEKEFASHGICDPCFGEKYGHEEDGS